MWPGSGRAGSHPTPTPCPGRSAGLTSGQQQARAAWSGHPRAGRSQGAGRSVITGSTTLCRLTGEPLRKTEWEGGPDGFQSGSSSAQYSQLSLLEMRFQVFCPMFQISQLYSESSYLKVMQKRTCKKQITDWVLQTAGDLKVNKDFNQVSLSLFLTLLGSV